MDSNFATLALKPLATVGWRVDRKDGWVEFHCGHRLKQGVGQFVIELKNTVLEAFNDGVLNSVEIKQSLEIKIDEVREKQNLNLMLGLDAAKLTIQYNHRK